MTGKCLIRDISTRKNIQEDDCEQGFISKGQAYIEEAERLKYLSFMYALE